MRTLFSLAALPVILLLASAAPEPPFVPTPYPVIEPRHYTCYRAATPVVVDGRPDEAWTAAPWSDDFIDIEGTAKPKPRFRTRMKMLHDADNLYVLAELEEPHVWGTLREHDSVIFADNDFEVFLDPDGDSHLYAEMELNALNTTWDLLLSRPYKDGGKAIDAWEMRGMKTAVRIDGTLNDPRDKDRGWTVEMALPFKALGELSYGKSTPAEGDVWRVNFSRVEWQHTVEGGKYKKVPKTKEDNWVWSPQGVIDMHRPERWGRVQFTSKKPGEAKPVADPLAAAKHGLHRIHYAQKEYRKARGRFATTLAELGLPGKELAGFELDPRPWRSGASVKDKGKRVSITHDGRIEAE